MKLVRRVQRVQRVHVAGLLCALAGLGAAVACGGSGDSATTTGDPVASSPSSSSSSSPSGPGGDASVGTNDGGGREGGSTTDGSTHSIQTVFVILMENHSWSTIKGNASAPYINKTLLASAAHAEQYTTPPGLHPSEPNYIWLEAGDNLGITTDDDPKKNHRNTKDHFTSQLEAAGISWKAYVEEISGNDCPLVSTGLYGTKHVPQLYFDDVTDTNSPSSQHCKDHIRPYSELATDLSAGKVARYNFITPNLCDDMHGQTFGTKCQALVADLVKDGDTWLSTEVPKILASKAYKDGGALFILWDEGDESLGQEASDGPLPAFVLSPFAKAGFTSNTAYTHSSTLHTFETIFGVPYLRGAQTSNDLSDMFTSFP
ncbi:putative acid phosphatase [Labilithrix luteola]|uniref:Putative acid phosphatase n=1 Tax=Labilithrix luteola TaxID=1391654 RepID=A0A0K1Q404_9BACT|nr:alkaline phosphatase family protein [Labilithrix luteola]AKV00483.1 putative acid phosphatase [Labilithrix luteola]